MPRVLRISKERRTEPVSNTLWEFLVDETDGSDDFETFVLKGSPKLREIAEPMMPEILDYFVAHHPGKRPWVWWRLQGEPRARLGGTGRPPWDCGLAVVPWFEYGLPATWAMDLWTLIGKVPPLSFVAFDPADPPVFESQATFLKRHELLLPGEAKRLRRADYAPEAYNRHLKKKEEKSEP